jgi:outer membrane receptor protein involved in Fe transport
VAVRNVGHIPNLDVPQYTVWDSRIGWRSTRGLDVDLVVQNLFDRTYSEFGPAGGRAVFGRTWFLKLRWQG